MSNTFAIGCSHFGHANIIKFQKDVGSRPFNSVEDMNEAMVSAWNSVVKNDDIVLHLGDIFFRMHPRNMTETFSRLNGVKHLIKGNHCYKETVALPWSSVSDYKEISHRDKKVILFHYPISSWNGAHHGSIHLHSHIHSTFPNNLKGPILKNRIDVGVDNLGIVPLTLDQIFERIEIQNQWIEAQNDVG